MATQLKVDTHRKSAIVVGVLYIIGTVAGILSVVFSGPVRADPASLLSGTAGNQMVTGALLITIMALALAMIPVVMFPILRKHNEVLALGYVVFRGALETTTYFFSIFVWLSLVVLGRAGLPLAAADGSSLPALTGLLLEGEAINSLTTIVFILGALMFYTVLYQSELVPRWLSGWGLVAAVPFLAAGLLVMFGVVENMSTMDSGLQALLGIQEMVLALWLIIKGFNPAAVTAEFA